MGGIGAESAPGSRHGAVAVHAHQTNARVKRCSLSWKKASSSTLRQKKIDLRDFREENAPRTRGYILLISPGPDLDALIRSVMLDEACSATAAPHSLSTSIYGVHLAHKFQK